MPNTLLAGLLECFLATCKSVEWIVHCKQTESEGIVMALSLRPLPCRLPFARPRSVSRVQALRRRAVLYVTRAGKAHDKEARRVEAKPTKRRP